MSGAEYDHNNIFAKIIRGEIPCHKIFETEHSLAILDAFPVTEGHALLLPKVEGYATMEAMPADVAAAFLADLPKLAKAVKEGTGADGLNICQNNGKCSGQEVPHVHVHVIPRYTNDTLGLKFPASAKEMITPEEAEKLAGQKCVFFGSIKWAVIDSRMEAFSGVNAGGIDRRAVEAQRKRVEELRKLRASRVRSSALAESHNASSSYIDRRIQEILKETLTIDEQLASLENFDISAAKGNSKTTPEGASRVKALIFRKPKLETVTSQSVVRIDSERTSGMTSLGDGLSAQKGPADIIDSYEKSTQCENSYRTDERGAVSAEVDVATEQEPQLMSSRPQRRRSSVRNPIFPRRGSTALDKMRAAVRAGNQDNRGIPSAPARADLVILTEEEKENICKQRDFEEFLQRASKIVEKAIGISDLPGSMDIDPFIDYATEEHVGKSAAAGGESVPLRATDRVFARFGEEGRLGEITDVRWHSGVPELFIAAGGAGSWQRNKLNGESPAVSVWSLAMPKRPEFLLRSHTAVVTAMSDKFNPTIYLGGSVSGSVLIWDTRAKFSPVQWSPTVGGLGGSHEPYSGSPSLVSPMHTQAICGMEIVGTRNAHHVTTVSSEGKVCLWSTAQLSEPHHSVLLRDSDQKDYSISAVAFSDTDANLITLGTHDGHVVRARLDSTTGNSTPWQVTKASLLAHDGMVTALDCHPLRDIRATQKPTVRRGFDDLLASGSVDWTAKLWNMAGVDENNKIGDRERTSGTADLSSILGISETPPAPASATVDAFKDTVTDVQWHPHHPAVLAASTVEGLHICNFNCNTESPILSIRTPGSAPQRIAWSADGRFLLAGDAEGRVTLYEADRSVYQPRSEEWTRFEGRLWTEEETTADEL
ncbi:Cytoplasmic dynein 1 intermediate chain 2 [Perkinsus olseni]|uniref:Cytoplasmic dynein 1 intermediate chain 2 n=1 Tax=Perkinsus olseni TaxID=32597 RepID=A0A7J6PLK5_PEROL|nr:Cytoplasmic dynein 1 intermediate chain 2 [Perkinsus olseni]